MKVLAGAISQQFILYNLDLLKVLFTFYHGKSALNHHLEKILFFSTTLTKSKNTFYPLLIGIVLVFGNSTSFDP